MPFTSRVGDYVVAASAKDKPLLLCLLCNESIPMQSNLAIAEELARISQYLEAELPACKNSDCSFFGKSGDPSEGNYVRYGSNAHGTPRFRCKECKKVFAFGGKSTKRQRRTSINRDVFDLIVNTSPIRRIIKMLKISPGTFYSRLDFIHRQCLLFVGPREKALMEMTGLGKRYITTDRQKLMVNWSSRGDRRNTQLLSMASADLTTGYVFGAHLNYDPSLDIGAVIAEAHSIGDFSKTRPFRRHARVWLPDEFESAAELATKRRERAAAKRLTPSLRSTPLTRAVEETYEVAGVRDDVEAEDPSSDARTPSQGLLLHETAVMNAHIQLVARLLCKAPKLRFFVDQESGLRAAIMAALPKQILARTVDAFFVSVAKEVTIDDKRRIVQQTKRRFEEARDLNPALTSEQVKVLMARNEMTRMRAHGKWNDRWLTHPLPDMREPEKMICWLTDIDNPESDPQLREDQLNHFARLYLKASLTAVDRFFMQVRRGLTLAERGIPSGSNERRLWVGKNAYNPGNLAKLLEVFRVYFNYCEVGHDKRTPAMRLGLARGPVQLEDILYFVPKPPTRMRRPNGSPPATTSRKRKKPLTAAAGEASEESAGASINS